jgi:hypothetical protein
LGHALWRYAYTEAWVGYLVRKLTDPATHQTVLGRAQEFAVPPDAGDATAAA